MSIAASWLTVICEAALTFGTIYSIYLYDHREQSKPDQVTKIQQEFEDDDDPEF